MSRIKPVPVYPKYQWDGNRIINENTVTYGRFLVQGLFGFDVYTLPDIAGVKNFLSKIHIGKFTSEKPNILLAVEASENYVNIYLGNSLDIFLAYAYMRLARGKKKWKLYECGVYD